MVIGCSGLLVSARPSVTSLLLARRSARRIAAIKFNGTRAADAGDGGLLAQLGSASGGSEGGVGVLALVDDTLGVVLFVTHWMVHFLR